MQTRPFLIWIKNENTQIFTLKKKIANAIFFEKMKVFGNFFLKIMSRFCQFFDSQMAIFQRVSFHPRFRRLSHKTTAHGG